jgi:protein phosphatase
MKFFQLITETQNEKVLIMTIGISGSGKSTYLNKHYSKRDVVSADQLRIDEFNDVNVSDHKQNAFIWGKVVDIAKDKLDKNGLVVIDGINVKSSDRNRFFKNFPDVTKKIAIVFKPDLEESLKRINKDLADNKNRAAVNREILEKQLEKYNNGIQNVKSQFDEVIYVN